MVLRKALFKALFLSLLLLPFSVWAETADDYASGFAQFMELSSDYCVEVVRLDAAEPWGLVTLSRLTGVWTDGGEFEIGTVACCAYDEDGRGRLLALYDLSVSRSIETMGTDFRSYARALRAGDGVILNTAIATILEFQRSVGTRLHVLHLSTREGIRMVAQAKSQGRPVTDTLREEREVATKGLLPSESPR